ncbi:protein phosphatase 1 regulatory subunit 1B-like isoform X3 [Clarias gariepinus]|uniref:protein phosphatase 1 regulatory subunit 1B-like isoform X3 n=1 Tax=Clarias gariepinus TaxID=13013 RepID=UPI00234DE3DB|nr:protein phosphatase 1 regulatory subunit 1B-like isoform X3 [Clarias gariepinus]
MEGEIKEGRKIQFSVPSAGPIQLDPRQVEMLFACENGVSKANNADTNVYQPPSLQAVQKMAQAHIKTSETPSLESSDSEEVSLDAPGDPPNEIKLECPSCSGGSAKEEKGKVDAENLRAESMKNGESGGKGDE